MNYDAYLKFFHEAIKQNILEERLEIFWKLEGKNIEKKECIKKLTNIKRTIVPLFLENEKILLIDDIPFNFLISHTILLGDKTTLYEFKLKVDEEKDYITDDKTLMRMKDMIDQGSIKKINPKELYRQKYHFPFKQPIEVENLKKYIKNVKNLDMDEIHVIKGIDLINFIPTIKKSHFNIAKKLHIPLIPLIDKNYIKNSSIHINDNLKHAEIVKAIKEYEDKIMWKYEKKTFSKLYKDISFNYYLNLKDIKEEMIEKINNSKLVNFDKEKIIRNILNINTIELGNCEGEYEIPIWKTYREQQFISIKDSTHFRQITGLEFKPENLEEIFIQNNMGQKGTFRKIFLKKNLENTFENLEYITKIKFSNVKELIINLILIDEPAKILRRAEIDNLSLKELGNNLQRILTSTIKLMVKFNKIPQKSQINDKDEVNRYLQSIIARIEDSVKFYKEYPDKNILFKENLKISRKLILVLKNLEIKLENLYNILMINLLLINVLKEFDKEKSFTLAKSFVQYFNYEIEVPKFKINEEQEKIIESIIFINKKSKKYQNLQLCIKKDINTDLINDKIQILDEDNKKCTEFCYANKKKLKEAFPYSHKEIINQINKSKDPKNEKFKIKNREINVKEDYLKNHREYHEDKVLINNEYITLFLSKSN